MNRLRDQAPIQSSCQRRVLWFHVNSTSIVSSTLPHYIGHQPGEQAHMTIDTETKTRENRLRRKASLYGLRLSKSPRRDPDALDYGLYGLFDERTNFLINQPLIGRFVHSWTLDDVEAYLISDDDEPASARKAMKGAAA